MEPVLQTHHRWQPSASASLSTSRDWPHLMEPVLRPHHHWQPSASASLSTSQDWPHQMEPVFQPHHHWQPSASASLPTSQDWPRPKEPVLQPRRRWQPSAFASLLTSRRNFLVRLPREQDCLHLIPSPAPEQLPAQWDRHFEWPRNSAQQILKSFFLPPSQSGETDHW